MPNFKLHVHVVSKTWHRCTQFAIIQVYNCPWLSQPKSTIVCQNNWKTWLHAGIFKTFTNRNFPFIKKCQSILVSSKQLLKVITKCQSNKQSWFKQHALWQYKARRLIRALSKICHVCVCCFWSLQILLSLQTKRKISLLNSNFKVALLQN